VPFILILKFREFADRELEDYAIKKGVGAIGIPRDILSWSQQETVLPGEGEIGLPQYPFPVGEKLKYFIYSAGIPFIRIYVHTQFIIIFYSLKIKWSNHIKLILIPFMKSGQRQKNDGFLGWISVIPQ